MQVFFFLNSNSSSVRGKKTGDAYELIITSTNISFLRKWQLGTPYQTAASIILDKLAWKF
jgi:hypothetical protein